MGAPQLYHHGMSVCAAKVRLALAEKEADWEGQYVNIRAGESLRPEYLKLNPKGVVPTLVHHGNVITESTVICEYVEETFAGPQLAPSDSAGRARMRIWTKKIDEGVHFPSCAALTFAIAQRPGFAAAVGRFGFGLSVPEDGYFHVENELLRELLKKTGVTASVLVSALKMHDSYLGDMEAALEFGPWLTGNMFTLADIGIAPYIQRLDCLQLAWLWEHRPRVAQWYNRIRSRASYEQSVVAWFDKEDIDLMEKNGVGVADSLHSLFEQAA